MKSKIRENNILWSIAMIILLGISYCLCRFIFFHMHGMKQWANILAIFSLIVIVIAFIGRRPTLSLATVLGYMGGFVLAMIFNTDGVDPGGGRINNAWIIWTVALTVCVLIGLIFDIYYKTKLYRGSSSIGIIGGSNGPTSLFISNSDGESKQEKKWNQLLQTCKEIIVPKTNKITGEEIKKYLIDEYDARETELSAGSKRSLKYNVIINYYPEALQELKVLQNDKDMDHFNNFNNIELISDEKYNLDFCVFTIPRTPKTESFYQEFEQEINGYIYENLSLFSKLFKKPSKKVFNDIKGMELEIEISTGYMILSNGARSLIDEITLWKGVTQEDIDNCTPAFMSYAAAMRDTGKMVYCEEEDKWEKLQ